MNEPPRHKHPSPPFLPYYCALSVLLLRRVHHYAHVLGRVLLHKEHGLVIASLEIDRAVQGGCRGLCESWPAFRQIYMYTAGTFLQRSISHTHHTE